MQKSFDLRFITYALLAFLFGIISRYYWVYWANGIEDFIYNGSVMINTNDGYFFAEGAKDILDNFIDKNPNSNAAKQGLSIITAFIYKITPFSFENILLYLSGFLSSLLVVPILLISREFKALEAGFIGSLVSVVAMSYYNRTMYGYYDTDMLVIVLPMFVLWGMIRVASKGKRGDIIIAPIFLLLYIWWYPASYSLNIAFIAMMFFYTIVFDRKNIINYELCIIMLAATTNLSLEINFIIIMVLYILFLKKIDKMYMQIIAIGVFLTFIFNGGLNPIIGYLNSYVFRVNTALNTENLIFFNVNETIPELSQIDKTYFMERISSHVALFTLSLIGYILMCFKNRAFLLSLPMMGLGFLALKGGLRFTVYAVPTMGLGLGFLYIYLANFFKANRYIKIFIVSIVTVLSLVPALKHIYIYKSSTVFSKNEVEILGKFKDNTTRDDYALAWWDYGYPIRYYTNANTLIDGAVHSGEVNFPVSFALTKDQISSANMARLAVEYEEKRIGFKGESEDIPKQNIKWMMKDYGINNVNDFLLSISLSDFKLPKKTREIYYYLPLRMMNIFTTINYFSNLDLNTGEIKDSGVFVVMHPTKKEENGVVLNGNLLLSNDVRTLTTENKEIIRIKNFYQTGYDNENKFVLNKQTINSNGDLNMIFSVSGGFFILLDDKYLNSTYVKLFFLQEYDLDIFEPVILKPYVKIYRLKR